MTTPTTTGTQRGTIMAYAQAQVGKPYGWGKSGPNSFDCSGLTLMAYRQIGKGLPHSSAAQSMMGTAISRSQLQPGDLICWQTATTHHVALFLSGNDMISAPETGQNVKVELIWGTPTGYRNLLGDAGGSFALPNITNIGIPGVDQLGQIIGAMKSWVKIALWMQNPVNWLRMFTIVAGAVLLLIGIIMLSNQTDNTSAAIKTVKKVVTV